MTKKLLKNGLICFVALHVLSCRSADQEDTAKRIPLDLVEVNALISDFPTQDPTLNIVFDDSSFADLSSSGTSTLGKCLVETNTITIDERFWVGATTAVKEVLLYHEMAHCLLGVGHHSDTVMDSFVGFSVQSYQEKGLTELGGLPCSSGCDLPRIQTNRTNFNSGL